MKTCTAVMERCPATGLCVAHVPDFAGAHAQGASPDEVHQDLRDVIKMLLKDNDHDPGPEVAVALENVNQSTRLDGAITLKPSEICDRLEALGFIVIGFIMDPQRGSHLQFHHPDGRCTTVPSHTDSEVSPLLLRLIERDIGLSL